MPTTITSMSTVRLGTGRIVVDGISTDFSGGSDFTQPLCDAWWLSRIDPDDGAVAGDDVMVSWSEREVALDSGGSKVSFECDSAHRALGLLSNAWNVATGRWPFPTAQCGA